jgi:hypothetical protein
MQVAVYAKWIQAAAVVLLGELGVFKGVCPDALAITACCCKQELMVPVVVAGRVDIGSPLSSLYGPYAP